MTTTEWEELAGAEGSDASSVTMRLRVPGGWLYQVRVGPPDDIDNPWTSVALCFVPDPTL